MLNENRDAAEDALSSFGGLRKLGPLHGRRINKRMVEPRIPLGLAKRIKNFNMRKRANGRTNCLSQYMELQIIGITRDIAHFNVTISHLHNHAINKASHSPKTIHHSPGNYSPISAMTAMSALEYTHTHCRSWEP